MAGWSWVECSINAPAKDVFEYFSDDTDKLSYLMPTASVLNVLERERLPHGGQRVRLVMKVGPVTQEVAAEDTDYVPYSLLRGRSSGPSGTIESEKRFTEEGGRTRLVWGTRVARRRGLARVVATLLPASTELTMRLLRLDTLARARAALEPWARPHVANEPAWVAPHMPPPVAAPLGWVKWAAWVGAAVTTLAVLIPATLLWPFLRRNIWLQPVVLVSGYLLATQLVSLVALRLVRWKLPDSRRS